jgi:hypothetical protein
MTVRPRPGVFAPLRVRVFVSPHHLSLNPNTLHSRIGVPVYASAALGAGVLPAHLFTHGIMRTDANWSVRYATTMQ